MQIKSIIIHLQKKEKEKENNRGGKPLQKPVLTFAIIQLNEQVRYLKQLASNKSWRLPVGEFLYKVNDEFLLFIDSTIVYRLLGSKGSKISL